mmetsp:Transcript_13219/g.17643  ORF Transcript_13219/g.17643 Transcript_13219/m.17643 type:complete len:509 (+) Transcript_13219:181-1707(+)
MDSIDSELESALMMHVDSQDSDFLKDALEIRLGMSSSSKELTWNKREGWSHIVMLVTVRDGYDSKRMAECIATLCLAMSSARALIAMLHLSSTPAEESTGIVFELRRLGLRCIKVHRQGKVDVWESCGPDFKKRLTGSVADSSKRRIDRYKVEKRLGLAEYGDESTLFCDKAEKAVANGYERVLYGDHGTYLELGTRHLVPGYLQRTKVGEYYDVLRGERCQAYFQKKTVSTKHSTPKGKHADESKLYRPEGYADYRPGFYYIDLHKLGVVHHEKVYYLAKHNKPPRAKIDRVRATFKHHDIVAFNFENCGLGPISLADRAKEISYSQNKFTRWTCVQTRLWNAISTDGNRVVARVVTLIPYNRTVDPRKLLKVLVSRKFLSNDITFLELTSMRDVECFLGQKRSDILIPFVPLLRFQANYTVVTGPRRLRKSRIMKGEGRRDAVIDHIIDTPIFASDELFQEDGENKLDLLYFHSQLGGVRLALAPFELLRATAAVILPRENLLVVI